jgi:predicted RNase H-like nuclease (RuvC/YqgF family)
MGLINDLGGEIQRLTNENEDLRNELGDRDKSILALNAECQKLRDHMAWIIAVFPGAKVVIEMNKRTMYAEYAAAKAQSELNWALHPDEMGR